MNDMKRMLVPLALLFLCGADDCDRPKAPPASMHVVEYSEITGSMPGPTVHVWLVADDKRDLCFVVFNSGGSSVAPMRIDCAGVKPKPERGCP